MTILLRAFLAVWLGLFSSLALAAAPDHLADALASSHYLLMMRHAEAPGTGDPAGHSLDDCSTQRNLGEAGRRQAVSTGEWLRRQGINRTMLYSSPWCRCKDTAQGLNLGDVVVEPALIVFRLTPSRRVADAGLVRFHRQDIGRQGTARRDSGHPPCEYP